MKKHQKNKVPTKDDWGNYKADLDVKYAYKLYGEKSIDEVKQSFIDSPIERADELLFATFPVFKYYVFCFVEYLQSEEAKGDSDTASVFIRLVKNVGMKHPKELKAFYPELKPCIDFVANNQEFFDADYDIYGSFSSIREEIHDII